MLRKLIFFALASGLAKKGFELLTNKLRDVDTPQAKPRRAASRRTRVSPAPTHQRATTVGESS